MPAKHIELIRAEGLRLWIPPHGAHGFGDNSKHSTMTIGEIVADGGLLEIAPRATGQPPLRFEFSKLNVQSVASGRPLKFTTTMSNPKPPGEIRATGQVGPWNANDWKQTSVSGSYQFLHADLDVFSGISGVLSSEGKFSGILQRIEVNDAAAVPDFALKRSEHPVDLQAQFQAFVNGTNGDVTLQRVETHFARTTVLSQGFVIGKPGQPGKTVAIDITVREGRIQDLLHLILKSDRPPMTGVVSFKAKATVPPEPRKFIEKVELQGDFGIGAARFTSSNTQGNVDKLSEHARGDTKDDNDPESVISNLKGHVAVRNGIATFSNLSFGVPGALAEMAGTYNLLNERVDLAGTLRMDAKLSQATKGVKSFLLKAVDPLFKKKGGGAIVPVKITGTYLHPSFAVVMTGKKPGKR